MFAHMWQAVHIQKAEIFIYWTSDTIKFHYIEHFLKWLNGLILMNQVLCS